MFRRAVTLLLLTLVAPGSAQLLVGHRGVGRVALKVAGGVVGLAVTLALLGLVSPGTLVGLLANPAVLRVVHATLIVLAVAWVALFIDAWRLGVPLALRQRQRLVSTIVTVVLATVAMSAVLTSSHYVTVARQSLSTIFAGTEPKDPYAGRYNILLLGADAGPGRVGLRPDSITLVSVEETSGRTAMFSFPRNLQRVRFPAGTVMHRQFPDGFSCGDDCLLNSIYTWATDHKELFPGVDDPGIEATKDAIRGLTGLTVHYYALIDMAGFEELVDAVGGITIDVGRDVPITGPGGVHRGTIKAGRQHMDGYTALWFARSRAGTSDYDRMARQRCVLGAMLDQLDPATVALKFRQIAGAGQRIVSTDIPASKLGAFVDLALKARNHPIVSVQFVPPLIKPARPDFDLIKEKVREAIEVATTPDESETPSTGTTASGGSSTSGSSADPAKSTGAGTPASGESGERDGIDTLGSACAVSRD
ncbi:LCP family protein [Thermasporomyces composti]|jgi:LCP family protein required for cell wall assembly|uniref:LytR family transcriptional attenuator n=1 Tax=Thermasporomyces composti TaxID=696763 RepID=A0A3D9V7L2_THECX|nr:LCP family protein [Thermasporomyces composti]REF37497.1 LytR family transcriptional attenuator [Thermasporomyces composti]